MRTPAVTLPAVPEMEDHDLYFRLRGEFREMPGLRLTVRQAARLFAIEPPQCERVLAALVRDRILASDGAIFALAPNFDSVRTALAPRRARALGLDDADVARSWTNTFAGGRRPASG
jgi:hypothetical protein